MRVRVDSGVDEAALRGVLACGVTDMRGGFHSLAARVQTVLQHDPYTWRNLYFQGPFYDRQGMCLYAKKLDRGRFRVLVTH